MWKIEFTQEFEKWFETLSVKEQDAIDRSVLVLERLGPKLGRPHVDSLKGSRHSNMKELRTQAGGHPLRTLFVFDPRRGAILLIGGNKTGDKRFYKRLIPIADGLYDEYLEELRKEGLIP